MNVYLWHGRVTRFVQPAGRARRRPLRYRHGVAVRLPGRRVLIVTFGRGHA